MPRDKPPDSLADPDVRGKDVNENNTKEGLLKQFSNLFKRKDPISTTSVTSPLSTATTSNPTSNTSPAKPAITGSSRVTSTSPMSSAGAPEPVTNLKLTLESDNLGHFRTFLRTKLDQNKSDNLEHKKMFEQWLDYVIICKQVFELPETDAEKKTDLLISIGDKFLAKPPDGYNIALKSQLNRKELVNHCRALAEKVPDLSPDQDLLKDGYEFIFGKLEQKHDIFKKTYVPTTTLAAFLCSVL